MKTVEPNARLRQAVRGFYAWLGSVLLAAIAPFISSALIERQSVWARVSGVAVGTLAWVPMMIVVGVIISRGDEFQQRMHLMAIAFAFAATLLLVAAIDWLVQAELAEPPAFRVLWLAIAMLWFIGLMASKWYFERQQ